jgi:FkbM family methyltransferase
MRLELQLRKSPFWIRLLVEELEGEARDESEVLQYVRRERLINEPVTYVDIGARGGLSSSFGAVRELLHVVLFEPDPNEFTKLRAASASENGTTVLPYAIGSIDGEAMLHLTRKRACSSILEPKGFMSGLFGASVNGAGREYGDTSRFDVEDRVEVECATLTTALKNVVEEVDILKIDTQGLELEILKCIGNYRPFLINVECSTTDLYKGQGTVFEVGSLLRGFGYFPATLMDRHLVPSRGGKWRNSIPLHGDCMFVPDGSTLGRQIITRDPEKWLVSLGIHGLLGLALWQKAEFSISLK